MKTVHLLMLMSVLLLLLFLFVVVAVVGAGGGLGPGLDLVLVLVVCGGGGGGRGSLGFVVINFCFLLVLFLLLLMEVGCVAHIVYPPDVSLYRFQVCLYNWSLYNIESIALPLTCRAQVKGGDVAWATPWSFNRSSDEGPRIYCTDEAKLFFDMCMYASLNFLYKPC